MKFEEDRAELRLDGGSVALTPLASDPNEQDAIVSFSIGELSGSFVVQYLNAEEFARRLRKVHTAMKGKAELRGDHPKFKLRLSLFPAGNAELEFRYKGGEFDTNAGFKLALDQSYLPDFLNQLTDFNRSQAFRLS